MKATELKDWLAVTGRPGTDSGPLLLDVREPWEYARCHIKGSELVPMREVMSNIDALDPDRETVVICHHGIRSRQVCRVLEAHGFTKLINLSDGIDGWARRVDPDMPVY